MELSHFLSMLQYEVLKSFDFTSFIQDEEQNESISKLQLAMESAEVKIPLVFDRSLKELDLSKVNEKLMRTKTHIDMPFNANISKLKLAKGVPLDAKKKPPEGKRKNTVKGETITVQVANSKMTEDKSFDPMLIGCLTVKIKPVLK